MHSKPVYHQFHTLSDREWLLVVEIEYSFRRGFSYLTDEVDIGIREMGRELNGGTMPSKEDLENNIDICVQLIQKTLEDARNNKSGQCFAKFGFLPHDVLVS